MWKQKNLFTEEAIIEEKPAKTRKPSVPKRRKKAKRQVDDYYMLLDVSEFATVDEVKRSYIAKVRQYPPENHPNEFQRIRAAYETLRDKKLRKEYDIIRKYGESIEDLLADAMRPFISTTTTVNLLKRALLIDPECRKARFLLAYKYLGNGKQLEFEGQFYELKHSLSNEDWIDTWTHKIMILLDLGYTEDAMHELKEFTAAYPEKIYKYWNVYVHVYSMANCEAELLSIFEQKNQQLTGTTCTQSMKLYVVWLQVADALANRKGFVKAQTATKRFIKNFHEIEDIAVIVNYLLEQYQACWDEQRFTSAQIFIDLALVADKQNKKIQSLSINVQEVTAVIREINRMMKDRKMFPVILLKAVDWIHEKFQILEDILEEIDDCIPEDLLNEMEQDDDEYAAGLYYLQKKYPHIYDQWKPAWDDLLLEKTRDMNRDSRRKLR